MTRNRILIVDDSEVTRAALSARLTQRGASVVCAASVEAALALDVDDVSAAIVDVNLGHGDNGVGLADVLLGRKPTLRLALFTAAERASAAQTTFRKPDEVDRVVAWALAES